MIGLHDVVLSTVAYNHWLLITPSGKSLRSATFVEFCFSVCLLLSSEKDKEVFDRVREATAHMSLDEMVDMCLVQDSGQSEREASAGITYQ